MLNQVALGQIEKNKVLIKKTRKKYINTYQSEVSIITPTNKAKYMNNIFNNYSRIIYPNKELIIILNNNKLNIEEYKKKAEGLKDVQIFQLDENYTLGECLNFGIKQSKYDYISKVDDDDYYCGNYLLDLMNVFKYTDAQLTGKRARFIYLEDNNNLGIKFLNQENIFVSKCLAGGTLTFKKEIFEKVKFQSIKGNGVDTCFLRDCNDIGIKMFAADKYNYVYMKHKSLDDHTWKITSKEIIRGNYKHLLFTQNFIPFVTA